VRPGPLPGAPAESGGVRRAIARDLERLTVLWRGLVAHHAAFDSQFELRAGAGDDVRRRLAALLRDRGVAIFVYADAGDLAGFCSARVERAPAILRERRRGQITDLAVREGSRRRGIGTALVRAAETWIAEREVERVEVRVAVRNGSGQAFWRALGYGDLMDVLERRL